MENQNQPPTLPRKSGLGRVVAISLAIVFFIIFISAARLLTAPGFFSMALEELRDGKMENMMDGLRGMSNNLTGAAGNSQSNYPASNQYLIKQKSILPFSIKAPRGTLDAKASTDFTTVGYALSKSRPENYGWQTDWKVIVNSVTDMGTKTQIVGPGMHTSALTTEFTPSSMQFVYYFTLLGVKEGDTFPVRYIQKNMGDATFHFNQKEWIFYDDKNKPVNNIFIGDQERSTIAVPDDAKNIEAILVKNNGIKGAVIGFKPAELTADQKAQLESARQVIQGAGEFSQWWNSQIYPMVTNLPQMPPFRIVLDSDLPEKGYFEEEITNSEYANPASDANTGANPNDRDGDKIPDLAPLPGSGTR